MTTVATGQVPPARPSLAGIAASFAAQSSGYPSGAYFALLAAVIEGRRFGHRTTALAVHIHVVKEDELGISTLAGFDRVAHDTRPHFLPDLVIVLQTNEQMHNAGTGNGADGLVFIREIGGECFGRAMCRPRIAANYAESLIPCGEKFDEFVCNGTACSKNGDHSNPAFARRQVWPLLHTYLSISHLPLGSSYA